MNRRAEFLACEDYGILGNDSGGAPHTPDRIVESNPVETG
jgi:hypothetical protein